MITLYGFGTHFGIVDTSPFVLKVDAYLRMAGIPFEFNGAIANMKHAPKGKLPFIRDGEDVFADSHFILCYLKERYGDALDASLSPEQRATAYLISRSLDESLSACLVYSRWIDASTWPLFKQEIFGDIPFPLRSLIAHRIQKNVRKTLHRQGTGRHKAHEVEAIAAEFFQSLSTLLGEKPYFFGQTPSSLDATAFGHLSQFIFMPFSNAFNASARQHANLTAYCQRIQQRFYTPSPRKD